MYDYPLDDFRFRASQRREQVEDLHRQGLPQVEIASRVGITQARVSQILKEFKSPKPRLLLRLRDSNRHMLRLLRAESAAA